MTRTEARSDGHTLISPLLVPRAYRVIEKLDEGADVCTLHVVPESGELPSFEPAQVSMLGVFGIGEAAISISSPLDVRDHHSYTIRRAGPITNALAALSAGDILTIRGPFGVPWPVRDVQTGRLIIVGGGVGMAPLRAVIHAAIDRLEDPLDPLQELVVLQGAKRPDELFYRTDRDVWAERGATVRTIVDEPDAGWRGSVGVVTALIGEPDGVSLEWNDTTAFVCGPDVMMHFCARKLIELGVVENRIWLTLERNMQCGNALCGHCQLGPFIVCRDGPVANYSAIERFQQVREL